MLVFNIPLTPSDGVKLCSSSGYGAAYASGEDGPDTTCDNYLSTVCNPNSPTHNMDTCAYYESFCGDDTGGGGDTGGDDTGGGDTGLTVEQLAAIAAVIEALQNAQSYANSAAGGLSSLNALYNTLSALQYSLNDSLGQLSGAVSTINNSLSLVSGYLLQGQALGPQALAMINSQVTIAVLQRGIANNDNKSTQGYSVGDPVLIASGIESFTTKDYSYKVINDILAISRQFRSNQTNLKSSFGRSWFFNYDTNIIAGRDRKSVV